MFYRKIVVPLFVYFVILILLTGCVTKQNYSENINVLNTSLVPTQTIVIDQNTVLTKADNRLQGFLLGVNYVKGNDYNKAIELLSALRPTNWRLNREYKENFYGFVVEDAHFDEKFNTKIVMLVQDSFNAKYGIPIYVQESCENNKLNCFESFSSLKKTWSEHVSDLVNEHITKNIKVDYYDILNEPNWGWNNVTAEQRLELMKIAYDIIKEKNPTKKIVIPSIGFYSYSILNDTINFVHDNNMKIDAISWHELNGDCDKGVCLFPEEIPEHVNEIKQVMQEKLNCDTNCPEIHINEYEWNTVYYEPGWAIGYLYYLTKSNVDVANRACWGGKGEELPWSTCFDGFDGLLTKDNKEPQSIYWIYKAYADMSGNIIESNSTNKRTVALSSFDSEKKEIKIILGTYAQNNTDQNILLKIKNFAFIDKNVNILVEKVPSTNNKVYALSSPEVIANTYTTFNSSEANLMIPHVKDNSAYIIVIKSD